MARIQLVRGTTRVVASGVVAATATVSALGGSDPCGCSNAGYCIGQAKISSTSSRVPVPLYDGDNFGTSVAELGDLDGDGRAELAVGAFNHDGAGVDQGGVWILSLNGDGSVFDATEISQGVGGFVGPLKDGDRFGASVAAIGDVNGDGVADLAVGAHTDDDGGENRGAVWILFLTRTGTVQAQQKISTSSGNFAGPLHNNDAFGIGLGAVGDRNGDGVPDLAVGAHLDDDGGPDRGAVWMLSLTAAGTVMSSQKISSLAGGFGAGLPNGALFGADICPLGDLDGDGVGDVAIGAPLDALTGSLWIVFLNADDTVKAKQKLANGIGGFQGAMFQDDFGLSIARLGDLDGDSVTEIAVGADAADDGGAEQGAFFVLRLKADGTVKSQLKVSEVSGGFGGTLDIDDRFGGTVSLVEGVDLDGQITLAVSAGYDDDGGPNRGAVWLLALDGCDLSLPPQPDLNQDCMVNAADLALLLGAWGPCSSCDADLDGDGAVGAKDLAILLGGWTG